MSDVKAKMLSDARSAVSTWKGRAIANAAERDEARAEVARLTKERVDYRELFAQYQKANTEWRNKVDDIQAEVARWQAIATRAVEVLKNLPDAFDVTGYYSDAHRQRATVVADFAAGSTLDEHDARIREAKDTEWRTLLLGNHDARVAQEAREAALEEAAKYLETDGAATLKRREDRATFILAAEAIRALAKKATP